jgi:hypothetical protein
VRRGQRQSDVGCDRRHNRGWQIFVSDVALNDERRARLFDLMPDGGIESYVVDFSAPRVESDRPRTIFFLPVTIVANSFPAWDEISIDEGDLK